MLSPVERATNKIDGKRLGIFMNSGTALPIIVVSMAGSSKAYLCGACLRMQDTRFLPEKRA